MSSLSAELKVKVAELLGTVMDQKFPGTLGGIDEQVTALRDMLTDLARYSSGCCTVEELRRLGSTGTPT